MISEIYIKNIRGFKELSKTKIRRLTLLVGENSTGKTTFLGAYNALTQLLYKNPNEKYDPFNKGPFDFGTFQNTVYKGEKEFLLGGSFQTRNKKKLNMKVTFGNKLSNLNNSKTDITEKIAEFKFNDDLDKEISLSIKKEKNMWKLISNNYQFEFRDDIISQKEISAWLSESVAKNVLPYHGDVKLLKSYEKNISDKEKEDFNRIVQILRKMPLLEKEIKIIALPPVHPEIERFHTSNPLENNENIQKAISKIGQKIDLFSNIRAKKSGGVYELLIKSLNEEFNIKDVGFGVSSVFPFLKKFSGSIDEETVFLLQQPEIHLHPKAQAKITQILAKSKSHFLIETHSDYIIKRLRICIMKKIIKPDDLQILYFEQKTNKLKIHEINVDEDGNLTNPPKNYGDFFFKESDEFLGF